MDTNHTSGPRIPHSRLVWFTPYDGEGGRGAVSGATTGATTGATNGNNPHRSDTDNDMGMQAYNLPRIVGTGGAATPISITGTATYFAAGGGGGTRSGGTGGAGGTGGGGGAGAVTGSGGDGATNTGSGGGGGG